MDEEKGEKLANNDPAVSDDQASAPTEMYKFGSHRAVGGFGETKKGSTKEKIKDFIKKHKVACVLIGVAIIVVVALFILLMIHIFTSEDTSNESPSSDSTLAEPHKADPDIDILNYSNGDSDSGVNYDLAVNEAIDYYEDDSDGAIDFINKAVEEAISSENMTVATDILVAMASRYAVEDNYELAYEILKSVDLNDFSEEERTLIANNGMDIALTNEDEEEYEYWSTIYQENTNGGSVGG